jgi:uncharacterized membrane protein SirB2
MLFNIVVDMLVIIIGHAKNDGQTRGVFPHLVDTVLFILQYAEDTMLFTKHDLKKQEILNY